MMGGRNYQDLIAWQKAMDFVTEVYRVTAAFPKEEIYGLTTQLRRAVVSTACNIAEGQGRRSSREFLRFLAIAHGSLREVETQILIARRLSCISDEQQIELITSANEIGRLVTGLANSIKRKIV